MSFREALARSIAPHMFATHARVERALLALDALGLTDAEKTAAVEMAGQLTACGVDDDMVHIIGKIAASGRITGLEINQMANHGIQIRIHPCSTYQATERTTP